ncbi:MAG: RNA-binding S4 domain-containing protein [Sulfurimonadaceae bacterium]|jgi:ribosome-associated protein|nr:RNA-binding S4 domain-containing protein [Sulfurimonadaceae bacterium]
MLEFKLQDTYIELHKLLKVLDLVDSGAEAKLLIAEGHLTRNGEVETRKSAKIVAGDILQIAEVTIKVIA